MMMLAFIRPSQGCNLLVRPLSCTLQCGTKAGDTKAQTSPGSSQEAGCKETSFARHKTPTTVGPQRDSRSIRQPPNIVSGARLAAASADGRHIWRRGQQLTNTEDFDVCIMCSDYTLPAAVPRMSTRH